MQVSTDANVPHTITHTPNIPNSTAISQQMPRHRLPSFVPLLMETTPFRYLLLGKLCAVPTTRLSTCLKHYKGKHLPSSSQ